MDISLKKIALNAGAAEELDTTDFEVYLHGTSASCGRKIVESQGGCLSRNGGNWSGCWFTVAKIDVAAIFAKRSSDRWPSEKPMVVGMAIARDRSAWLQREGLLSVPRTENPPPGVSPTTPQYMFFPGAFQYIQRDGFFFSMER